AGIPLIAPGTICRVHGRLRVHAVDVRTARGKIGTIGCDLVCVSGGWNPSFGLAAHLGARAAWREDIAAFVPEGPLPMGMTVVGAAAGRLALSDALTEGARTGFELARELGFAGRALAVPKVDSEGTAQAPALMLRGTRGKAFVDFSNDVGVDDVALAV